jgi:REP element-mobilizing transposase RayT
MSLPRAYFLTWTCYGTWLHGDPRGSVDREHNAYGTPVLDVDPRRVRADAGRLANPPVVLDAAARKIVHDTIVAHCALRGWTIHALNVRTNHVHVVVACGTIAPETAMAQLKAWATRRLREAGCISAFARIWTNHGSTGYLWTGDDVDGAVTYVTDFQGPDLP